MIYVKQENDVSPVCSGLNMCVYQEDIDVPSGGLIQISTLSTANNETYYQNTILTYVELKNSQLYPVIPYTCARVPTANFENHDVQSHVSTELFNTRFGCYIIPLQMSDIAGSVSYNGVMSIDCKITMMILTNHSNFDFMWDNEICLAVSILYYYR